MKKTITIEYEEGQTQCAKCPLCDKTDCTGFLYQFGIDCMTYNIMSVTTKDE